MPTRQPKRIVGFIVDAQTQHQPLSITTQQIFALLLEAWKPSLSAKASLTALIEGRAPGELPHQMAYQPYFTSRSAIEDELAKVERSKLRSLSFPQQPFADIVVGSRGFCAAQIHLWAAQHVEETSWALYLLRRIATVPEDYCGWIDLQNLQVSSHPTASLVEQARTQAAKAS